LRLPEALIGHCQIDQLSARPRTQMNSCRRPVGVLLAPVRPQCRGQADWGFFVAEVQSDIARSVLAVLFILALIASTIRILRPFLGAIVWATTMVVATWPFMISLQAVLWNKRSLAGVVMSLLLLCVLVVPLSFAIAAIVSNLDDIAVWAKNLATLKLRPPPVLASKSSAGWRESRRAMGPHRRRRN